MKLFFVLSINYCNNTSYLFLSLVYKTFKYYHSRKSIICNTLGLRGVSY